MTETQRICIVFLSTTCRKLIGARYFNKDYQAAGGKVDPKTDSPRDHVGHGTHTLSTAGGRFVPNASIFSHAMGTAKGGSPNARVAAYKTCWPVLKEDSGTCWDADILAAIDTAIHDGVDVISISLGPDQPTSYLSDTTAIGAFHAVKKGISVICSAGNSGPEPGVVTNSAPWIFTVGASTIDRDHPAYLSLGNRKHIRGRSLAASGVRGFKPLVRAEDVRASNASEGDARACAPGSLDPNKVKGKIVVCIRMGVIPRLVMGLTVQDAGGAGMVLANGEGASNDLPLDPHFIPAVDISYSDSLTVFSYLNSTK